MNQFIIGLKSLRATIIVSSANRQDIEIIRSSAFLRRYIPAVEIIEKPADGDCRLIIKRGVKEIKLKYPRAEYSCPKFDEKDIVSLAEYLLERARQDKGLYCIHGSASAVNGRAVIVWGGASGMGKTTICRRLQEKFGAVWFADEKIVVDLRARKVVGWVSTGYLKNGPAEFQQLGALDHQAMPIGFFVYPIMSDDSCRAAEFEQWPKEKFFWHLNEELNRKIRGTSRLFFGGTEPVASLDAAYLSRNRTRQARQLVNKFPCFYAKGAVDAICKNIIKTAK